MVIFMTCVFRDILNTSVLLDGERSVIYVLVFQV